MWGFDGAPPKPRKQLLKQSSSFVLSPETYLTQYASAAALAGNLFERLRSKTHADLICLSAVTQACYKALRWEYMNEAVIKIVRKKPLVAAEETLQRWYLVRERSEMPKQLVKPLLGPLPAPKVDLDKGLAMPSLRASRRCTGDYRHYVEGCGKPAGQNEPAAGLSAYIPK